MKKLLILLGLISTFATAETLNFSGTVSTSCAFSNATTGSLVAHTQGSNYVLDGSFDGSGTASTVDIAYSGQPTFTINALQNLSSFPNGTPTVNQYNTGVFFGLNDNTANANAVGANSFTSGSKSFLLDNTTASSDTATVRVSARANSPFPVGNYSAEVVVSCQ